MAIQCREGLHADPDSCVGPRSLAACILFESFGPALLKVHIIRNIHTNHSKLREVPLSYVKVPVKMSLTDSSEVLQLLGDRFWVESEALVT